MGTIRHPKAVETYNYTPLANETKPALYLSGIIQNASELSTLAICKKRNSIINPNQRISYR